MRSRRRSFALGGAGILGLAAAWTVLHVEDVPERPDSPPAPSRPSLTPEQEARAALEAAQRASDPAAVISLLARHPEDLDLIVEGERALEAALEHEPDPARLLEGAPSGARVALLRALSRQGDERARAVLAARVESDPDPEVRVEALTCLSHAGGAAELARLGSAVVADPDLRRAAAVALGPLSDPEASTILEAALARETDPCTRELLQLALERRARSE